MKLTVHGLYPADPPRFIGRTPHGHGDPDEHPDDPRQSPEPIALTASRAAGACLVLGLGRRVGHSLVGVSELAVLCLAMAAMVALGALTRAGGGIEAAAALAVLLPCWWVMRRDDFLVLWSSVRSLRRPRSTLPR